MPSLSRVYQFLNVAHLWRYFSFSCYATVAVLFFDSTTVNTAFPFESASIEQIVMRGGVEKTAAVFESTTALDARTFEENDKMNRTDIDFLDRRFRSLPGESTIFLDRNSSFDAADPSNEVATTSTPQIDAYSLSGIIVFSWCVVALFGCFFAILIAAHWQWERRNGSSGRSAVVAKEIGKGTREDAPSRPASLLEEIRVDVEESNNKLILENRKSREI